MKWRDHTPCLVIIIIIIIIIIIREQNKSVFSWRFCDGPVSRSILSRYTTVHRYVSLLFSKLTETRNK